MKRHRNKFDEYKSKFKTVQNDFLKLMSLVLCSLSSQGLTCKEVFYAIIYIHMKCMQTWPFTLMTIFRNSIHWWLCQVRVFHGKRANRAGILLLKLMFCFFDKREKNLETSWKKSFKGFWFYHDLRRTFWLCSIWRINTNKLYRSEVITES